MPGPQVVEHVPHCPGTQCGELASGVVNTVQYTLNALKCSLKRYRASLDLRTRSWVDART